MIVGHHVKTHEIVVFADDEGLPVPMIRNAEGNWHEGGFDALTLMEDVVPIRDVGQQQALLAEALAAFGQGHRIAAFG